MAEGQDSPKKINVTVKTPKEKVTVEVEENASIKDFKELVAGKFNAQPEQLCLIFAGKIMKDPETLGTHNIKDGLTVHLVIKSNTRASDPAPANNSTPTPARPDVSATPFGLGALGGLGGLGALGMGSGSLMEVQQNMQQELLRNPDMLRTLMDNPLVQQIMGDPNNMRQLILSNPQMQELIERNPEINHLLNNPDLLRQTMDMARNPAMLQELMRSQDRAMSNLESIPGGYNALQRMYRDIQEPMLNAATEQFSRNPYAVPGSNPDAQSNPQQGQENRDPLPNPWGGGTAGAGTGAGAGGREGATRGSTMQSLMGQMMENPQLMQSMINAPYTQSMMQALAADPTMAQNILANNPLLASNPALQVQMREMMPTLLQQMQNPAMQQLMTNPEALRAVQQIQQGMEQLYTSVPGIANTLSSLGQSVPPGTTPATTPAPDSTTTTTTTTTSNTTGTPPAPAAPGAPAGQDMFSQFMARMVAGMAGQGPNASSQPPEERYRSQLEQLTAMGFVNREANLQANRCKMEHCELVSEMAQVEHMSTGERLALARRRRTTQLKLWATREREWERGRHRRDRTNHRRIRFSDSVMLLEAASRNDIAEVERLLEKGVSPDSTNEDGLTALHQCCIDDNEEMMKLLLQYGANVNAEDSEKWTPLHAAATCGHLHLVRYLIASGADLLAVNADGNMAYDICEDEAALEHIESEMARRGVTQQLIDETRALTETQMLADLTRAAATGADLELHDDNGATPLHIAAANGYLRVVEFLLDHHVCTDVKDSDDWQPVHAAACWGHLEVVELLVHNGADLNARTKHDETPADICEDPELRERITELRTEQESKRQQEARRRVKRTQSNNTRTQSVRRTSIRDKTLTSKKDAVEEARLRRQAQEDKKADPLTPIAQTPVEPKDDKTDPLPTPIEQTPQLDVTETLSTVGSPTEEEVFKQPVDVPDVALKLSPDLALDTRVEGGGGGGEWTEANGVLPLARREPEGKDSDSRHSADEGKGSPLELPTEASYTTEGNGKINIHVSVTINAGTLAELKKQRAQNRNSSPDISVIQAQTSARSSITGSEMDNPSVKRFAGNTGDNVIGDTKVRRCCILS